MGVMSYILGVDRSPTPDGGWIPHTHVICQETDLAHSKRSILRADYRHHIGCPAALMISHRGVPMMVP